MENSYDPKGVRLFLDQLGTAVVRERDAKVTFIGIAVLLNVASIIISASLISRFDEIKSDFESCPEAWLRKQGRIIYDWNVCTIVILTICSVHTLLKYSAFYAKLFDPMDAIYECDVSNGSTWEYWKCVFKRIGGTFMKCVESFLYVSSPLLPTITWAYFYIFPFDTLNSLLHGKIEGTDEYNYNETWRGCVPKHTDDVYNFTIALVSMTALSTWLMTMADFGKNSANVCTKLWNRSLKSEKNNEGNRGSFDASKEFKHSDDEAEQPLLSSPY
ncbi:hypothetical protein CYMTET_37059 [Cymbomonas tetramitiformis]|uniref:Uncharacterized protein n=1 Tax=Cymbomonas tetramitiformis TaxID=36881 RepID=A0AAE0CGC1_9CHLO|nr:hypothetical protein CYMTET_37059 [Cymbomonas tetramitiformis]